MSTMTRELQQREIRHHLNIIANSLDKINLLNNWYFPEEHIQKNLPDLSGIESKIQVSTDENN